MHAQAPFNTCDVGYCYMLCCVLFSSEQGQVNSSAGAVSDDPEDSKFLFKREDGSSRCSRMFDGDNALGKKT